MTVTLASTAVSEYRTKVDIKILLVIVRTSAQVPALMPKTRDTRKAHVLLRTLTESCSAKSREYIPNIDGIVQRCGEGGGGALVVVSCYYYYYNAAITTINLTLYYYHYYK